MCVSLTNTVAGKQRGVTIVCPVEEQEGSLHTGCLVHAPCRVGQAVPGRYPHAAMCGRHPTPVPPLHLSFGPPPALCTFPPPLAPRPILLIIIISRSSSPLLVITILSLSPASSSSPSPPPPRRPHPLLLLLRPLPSVDEFSRGMALELGVDERWMRVMERDGGAGVSRAELAAGLGDLGRNADEVLRVAFDMVGCSGRRLGGGPEGWVRLEGWVRWRVG